MGLLSYKIICAGFPACVENIGHTSKFGEWQGFPNSVKGSGDAKFCWEIFVHWGGGNLTRSDFDHLNFFNEHLLKSKLAWPVRIKSMNQSINCHLMGEIKIWWGSLLGRIFQVEWMSKCSVTGGTSPYYQWGKPYVGWLESTIGGAYERLSRKGKIPS